MKFSAEVLNVGQDVRVVLRGWLDERSEWPELPRRIAGDLFVDLEGVTLMNSMGCRNWIRWLKSAKTAGHVVLTRCSPVVVKQMNILEGFFKDSTRIDSVYVPYFCEDCGFEDTRLLDIAALAPLFEIPDVMLDYACPKCAKRMELDMIESQYFSFLKRQHSKFSLG